MIQSPSMKNSAWSTACETIRDPMNPQRDFLQYIIHLQKHLTISSPLLPPKYSRSSDWMTLFLIDTRNNGSQNNHTVRQKYHIRPKSDGTIWRRKEWLSCSPSMKPWSEMRKKNSLFCKWWSTIETSSQKH